jgi:DNA-directed RNA polymerase III subunit RPC1
VWHVGYFKHVLHVLQCICKSCSRVLLPVSTRETILHQLRKPETDSMDRAAQYRRVLALCKKVQTCMHCGAPNGTVRKAPNSTALRVLHDYFQTKAFQTSSARMEGRADQVEGALQHNPNIASSLVEASATITPRLALDLLRRVPDQDLPLLWADPYEARPEAMILQVRVLTLLLLLPPLRGWRAPRSSLGPPNRRFWSHRWRSGRRSRWSSASRPTRTG